MNGYGLHDTNRAIRESRIAEGRVDALHDEALHRNTLGTTARLRAEAVDYYALCRDARTLGIPVACDDPAATESVAELLALVSGYGS